MRLIGLLLFAGLVFADGPSFQPVAGVGQIMSGLIQPSAAAVSAAAKTPPQDDQAWRKAERDSAMLAEGGNLLMIGDRAKDQEGWMKDARALVDAAAAVNKAAHDKDAPAYTAAAANVGATCQGCHATYRQRRGGKRN
ncbi:MAG TPA: cytochrome c [Bryobacteraceae bacterium]|nr:cytochrome c [Bryobacteraceae bacterium]